jgi:hypothetical protein
MRSARLRRLLALVLLQSVFLLGPTLGTTPIAIAVSCPYLVYATDDSYTLLEDGDLEVQPPGVLSNDCGVPAQNPNVTWGQNSGDGIYREASDGSFTWLPGANENGLTGGDFATTYTFKSIGTSNAANVHVTVTPVNDAPFPGWYLPSGGWHLLEDAGPQSLSAVEAATPGGGSDETSQVLTGHASTDHPELFASGPSLALKAEGGGAWSGRVTFTPAPNANGSGTISLWITDNGGTANGGSNTTLKRDVAVAIGSVNDAPILTGICGPISAARNAGAQSDACFTAGPGGGGNDERTQVLTPHLSVESTTDPALFATGPTFVVAGPSDFGGNHATTLGFTPAAGHTGTATLQLWLTDDGGTANGGVDTGARHEVRISILAPGSTASPTSQPRPTAGPSVKSSSGAPGGSDGTSTEPSAGAGSSPVTDIGGGTPPSTSPASATDSSPGTTDDLSWPLIVLGALILLLGTNLAVIQLARARRRDDPS